MPPSVIRVLREAVGEIGTVSPVEFEATQPPPEVAAKIAETSTLLPEIEGSTTGEGLSTESPTTKTNELKKVVDELAQGTGLEAWEVISILVAIGIIILLICACCIRRCFRKRRAKDGKKGKGIVDLKSVQLLGSAYKEKVQPDMEELTENAEDIAEEGESKQSEQKLGKLQYKVTVQKLGGLGSVKQKGLVK